jgi:hypothetical protein
MIATLEFDLSSALLNELLVQFGKMSWSPLTSASLADLDITDGQGVYQLGLTESLGPDVHSLVYIGKTDAEAGLRTRLARHAAKIQNRIGLNPSDVSFKAIRVYVFTPMDLEQQLIAHYTVGKLAPAWTNSGFGSNDPGRQRDTSTLKETHFDYCYPIDTSIQVQLPFAVGTTVRVYEVLDFLKNYLTYTVRFETAAPRSRKPHPDLLSSAVTLTTINDTVENILLTLKPALVNPALGQPWQITVLPGYIIVYKESKKYPHGRII